MAPLSTLDPLTQNPVVFGNITPSAGLPVGSGYPGGLTSPLGPIAPLWGNGTPQDGVSQQYPQTPQAGAQNLTASSPLQQVVALVTNLLQALMGMLGTGAGTASATGAQPNATPGASQQTFVQNATIASQGDPHLSASGTVADGTTLATKFDSMTGHRDLVDSDSFNGGFRVSTQTTTPDANGVAYNQSASVATGDQRVTVDNSGNVTVRTEGQAGGCTAPSAVALAPGQTMQLDSGAMVTRNADGSVVVSAANGNGGTISTNITQNGKGVDAVTTAVNADLGGDIMNAATGTPAPAPAPQPHVYRKLPEIRFTDAEIQYAKVG